MNRGPIKISTTLAKVGLFFGSSSTRISGFKANPTFINSYLKSLPLFLLRHIVFAKYQAANASATIVYGCFFFMLSKLRSGSLSSPYTKNNSWAISGFLWQCSLLSISDLLWKSEGFSSTTRLAKPQSHIPMYTLCTSLGGK